MNQRRSIISPWRRLGGALIAILIFAAAPMIAVFIAEAIANANDCTLHEGFVNPCVVAGVDLGSLLYALGMAGWAMFFTLPAALFFLVVWCIAAGILIYRRSHA